MTNLLLGTILIFALLLAIPMGIRHWMKGLFHKHEEEEVANHFDCDSHDIVWLLTDHTFDTVTRQ